ncbi:MAG: hypothetical protein QM676_14350 [Novosphingobium sp.]
MNPTRFGALFGIVSNVRHLRMIHACQSSEGIAHDIARLQPAIVTPWRTIARHPHRAGRPLQSSNGATPSSTASKGFAGAELSVVDPESGAELPSGSEGVLEIVLEIMAPRIDRHWIRPSDHES